MLRNKPKSSYSGLTVVLQNPSRADKINLLSAKGGQLFSDYLAPDMNILQCDVRIKEDKSPLIDGTKCILLLGEHAAHDWLPQTRENPFGAIRGYPYDYNGFPTICSYFPQDAADLKNHEKELNPQHSDSEDDTEDGEKEGAADVKSRKGKTAWTNYKFWLRKDIERCKYILRNGIPSRSIEPHYHIYPNSSVVSALLRSKQNEYLYIDIETDCELNILCISFAFSSEPSDIYIVPIIDYKYEAAYSNIGHILASFAIAFSKNITVAHNGAAFDFFVFAHKLKISVGRKLYDTMIAHHRCFPEVEKSLGHCMSIWTWEPYHKDEGNFNYATAEQAHQLYSYCGKDVFGMILVHRAIEEYAKRKPGLQASIDQANASIRPYLISTLQGMYYKKELLDAQVKENDKMMEQYLRMLEVLIGKEWLVKIRGKGKSAMPSSNTQCVRYFHEILGYNKVGTTPAGEPSLGKENLFKLKLKYPEQAVIDVIIAYRETQKESGTLGFIPWKE